MGDLRLVGYLNVHMSILFVPEVSGFFLEQSSIFTLSFKNYFCCYVSVAESFIASMFTVAVAYGTQ